MKNKIKGLLALALAAFTGGLWAGVTSSFGVNFRTAEAQDIPADTAAGFTKGDYAQPTTWANLSNGNGKQDITVGDATLNVTWYSRGTYNSGADTSTLDGKLLYNYLDDTVNSGRLKAAVKITGLPADKQYAVALILSGDADNDGFNGKYSPAWINGQIYSYNAEATLLTGEDAVAATTWGSRRKPGAGGPSTFIEGTNVMFVEGVTGSELIITSAMDAQNVSRLTIAGVQVWVTDTTVTAPAVTAPTDSDVISVNFHSRDGAAADGDGLVAAKNWHNTTGATGTIEPLTVVNGDDSVASSGTLTYKAKTTWGYSTNVTTDFLKGYLDDGAHDDVVGATITATVPFENYSVIVYMATDTAGQFKPVIINDTLYAGSATLSSVGYADAKPSMMQNTSVCNWGASQTATAAYGVNALRVDGLSGNLTIQAGNDQSYNGIRNRGGIAAIQIVNTGDSILANVQKIDWSDKPAEELKVSELPELMKDDVVLTLPAGATLIVDTALPEGHSFVIVGDNVNVNITDWNIEKSAVEAVVSGATVTTAYTDTIGVEIDGVTYSYFFRGTTDANYGTVANWYTGKRVMGDQTKWFSVSGDVAPGVGGNMWHHMLLDGDMMDPANVTVGEDGYKTISATVLEGWNLGYFVRNGVHLNAATLNKIQNGDGFTAVWRVDDTSKITIGARGNSSHNNLANYYIDNEEGIVFTEFDIADANYYFDEDGSVKLDGVSGTQTIKAITLDLGTVAEGRKVVSRKVIGFNSSTATYTVEEGAVTTSVETVAATETVSLHNVGEYKFEQKEDGYYVNYVAYAPVAKKTNFVVTVGEDTVNCETFAEALEALGTAGGSLQIAADADPEALALAATVTITADTTIDFNGKTLTSTADPAVLVTGGTLTLNSTGAEGGLVASGVVIQQGVKNAGQTTAVVVGENVNLTSAKADETDGDNVVLMYGKATLTSAGNLTTYSQGYAAIQGSGGDAGAETAINITGGSVTSANDHAIYHPQAGSVTITGGTISGETGIEMRAGSLAMSGGTVAATAAYVEPAANNNGSTVVGAAIVMSQHSTGANVEVTITDGSVTAAEGGKTFVVANTTGASPVSLNATIGADVEGITAENAVVLVETLEMKTDASGNLTLGEKATNVARIGDTEYETLQAAVNDAGANATVELLADTTENITVPSGFTGTIDLGGNTLTGGVLAYFSNENAADFIIKNGNIYCETPVAAESNKGAILVKNISLKLINVNLTTHYHGIRMHEGAYVEINGGEYTVVHNTGATYRLLNVKAGAVKVLDGVFQKSGDYNGAESAAVIAVAGGAEAEFLGGTIKSSVAWFGFEFYANATISVSNICVEEQTLTGGSTAGSLLLTGGQYVTKPNVKFVAEGYEITGPVDGYYTVVKKPAIEPDGSIEVEAADAAAAVDKVEILIPEGVTGVDAATYATYFTKNAEAVEGTTDKWTVTAALNPEVVTPKITAISFDENGVTITLENKLPGLYYAVRSAATVDKVDTDEATVTTELNAPATGDAAFYRVLVDFAPIPTKPAE